METNDTVLRLSQLLPRDVRISIIDALIRNHSPLELARVLGYPTIKVESWLRGGCPDNEETARVLTRALRSDEVACLLTKFFGDVKLLAEKLNLLERQVKVSSLMEGLDEKSRLIMQCLVLKRHAGIRELADLIEASSDMDLLIRLREVINPRAEKIFGAPLITFERCRIDSITGEKILFSWWLSENLTEPSRDDALLDVFDEGNSLRVTAYLPSKDREDIEVEMRGAFLKISAKDYCKEVPLLIPVEGIVEENYNNGVLEVRLKKAA